VADDEDVLRNPLSVEDDEYEVVHEPPLTAVHLTTSLADARERARELVEHGLGATVAEVAEPVGFEIRVLPGDAGRAAELLGGAPPAAETGPGAGEADESGPLPPEPEATPPVPWKMLIAIWIAAMIAIPFVAFVGAVLLSR
jgi:hypothetical protein